MVKTHLTHNILSYIGISASILLVCFCLLPKAHASASNIYIAQSQAGTADGSSCANAKPVTFFNTSANWGSGAALIGPGTTVHLCGTITSNLTVSGSGSSGSPVTIYFEANAKISMPVCPGRGTGCIDTNGHSFITIDGGSNGIIEGTANGSGLANQVGSYGIEATACNNCEIKNLTIQNIYKRTSTSDLAIDGSEVRCVDFSGSNVSVHDSTCHDAGWGLVSEFVSGNVNIRVYNNNIYNIDHGWAPTAATGGGNYGPIYFYNNHVHDYVNWDSGATDAYHHDGIHCFSAQGTTGAHWSGIYIYDNRFDGNTGTNITSHIFLEGGSGSGATPCADPTSKIYIFNNYFSASQLINDGLIAAFTGSVEVDNNTVVGSVPGSGVCVAVKTGAPDIVRNNIISGCNVLISGSTTDFASPSSVDYNLYANCSSFNCWWVGNTDTANFNSYKIATGYDSHSINLISTVAGLDSTGKPQTGSQAIGTGINLSSSCTGDLAALCSDLSGVARGSVWDMGAYEVSGGSSATPVKGDINLDHIVNSIDYSILNSDWFTSNARSDLNSDGLVNAIDYSILNSNWFKTW